MNQEEILKRIKASKAEDYDGHTEFSTLTACQKLIWLSNTVYLAYITAKNNPKAGCNRFFHFENQEN